jgi:hypothetical protein
MKYHWSLLLRAAAYGTVKLEDALIMPQHFLDVSAVHLATNSRVAVDVGFTDPELRAGAQGSAATYAETKRNKYQVGCSQAGFTFVPLTCETFGTWNPTVATELQRLSALAATTRPITAAAFLSYWRQSIAVQLIRAVADSLLQASDGMVYTSNRGNAQLGPALRHMEAMQMNGF